jgi:hypothetical protein
VSGFGESWSKNLDASKLSGNPESFRTGRAVKLSETEKQNRIMGRVSALAREGWQVESHFGDTVILSRTKKIGFWLHLLLAIVTGGLSLIYVIYRVINRQRESKTIQLTANGEISEF